MTIKQRIDQDLKAALLSGNKTLATTLRGLKSVLLYAEVAQGNRETGLADDEVIALFAKEAKKRQESADLYIQGGNSERAEAELAEKAVIEQYLPQQLGDDELFAVVDKVIAEIGTVTPQMMGQVIAKVRDIVGASADGARIASAVKTRM